LVAIQKKAFAELARTPQVVPRAAKRATTKRATVCDGSGCPWYVNGYRNKKRQNGQIFYYFRRRLPCRARRYGWADVPKDHLRYIATPKGEPIGKKTLGRWFAEWCDAAGLPKRCRMHGLKKSAMCNIVLAGGTAPEMMAFSGHRDMRVAQGYIEKILGHQDLADAAITKLKRKRA
jgi:hypothetical protein